MKLMVKDYITKKEMQDILAKAPEGVRPEVILRGLVDAGKVIEGYNEEQMGRNRPMEIISGLGKSAASFMPRTVGVSAPSLSKAADSNFAKFLPGPAGDVLRTIKKTKPISKPLLERLGKKGTELADKGEEAVTKFMGSTGVRQDTGFAKGGKLGGDILQSVVGGPRGANFPGIKAITQAGVKEGSKMFAKYAAPRAAIGVGEELKYNIGTEGSLTRDDGTADMIIGPLAEVLVPIGFSKAADLFQFKGADDTIKNLSSRVKAGDMTETEAIAELVKGSQKWSSIPNISDDVVQQAAKDPELLQEYYNTVLLRNSASDAPTALSKAVDKAQEATDMIVKQTRDVGSDIGKFKQKVSNLELGIDRVKQIENQFIEGLKKFNAELVNGKIRRIGGKVGVGTPSSDLKILQEMYDLGLKPLKQSPKMDNFFDYLAGLRTKSKFETQLGGKGSTNIESFATETSGKAREIGRSMMNAADKALFDEYSALLEFLSEWNKVSKTDARMGLLLRRATSLKATEQANLLDIIEKYTGIDLAKHAYLARIATELLAKTEGQKTLLQSAIKNAGSEVGNALIDAATGNPTNAVVRLVSKLRPKKDPSKLLLNVAKKYDPGYSYKQAKELLEGLKDAGYKGGNKVPTISLDTAKDIIVKRNVANKIAPDNFSGPKVGTQSSNNPMQVRGLPGAVDNVSDDLLAEARKYKTADEFVKSKVKKLDEDWKNVNEVRDSYENIYRSEDDILDAQRKVDSSNYDETNWRSHDESDAFDSYEDWKDSMDIDYRELEGLSSKFFEKRIDYIKRLPIPKNDIDLLVNNYKTNGTAWEKAINSIIEGDIEGYNAIMKNIEGAKVRHSSTNYDELRGSSKGLSEEAYKEYRKQFNPMIDTEYNGDIKSQLRQIREQANK